MPTFPWGQPEQLNEELESLADEIVGRLEIPPPNEAIEVYLFRDGRAYEAHLRRRFPGVPMRRALFIKDDGPGMVFVRMGRDVNVDLRHECTHAVLHASLPLVPLWLDEGLAEYFEPGARRRVYSNPYLGTVRRNAWFGYVPSMSKLESKEDLSRFTAADYRNAWAWVHFMLHGPRAGREALKGYLADISGGVPPGRLSERLRREVPDLRRRFLSHFKTWAPATARRSRPVARPAARPLRRRVR